MSAAENERMKLMAADLGQTERIRGDYFRMGYVVGHKDGVAGAPAAPDQQYAKLRMRRAPLGGKKTRGSKKTKRSITRRR